MDVLCGVSSQLLLLLPGLQRRVQFVSRRRGWPGGGGGSGQEAQSILSLQMNLGGKVRGPGRAAPVSALLSMWGRDKCRDYFKEKPIRVVNRPKGGNRAEREPRMTAGLPTWWMGWEDICRES